VFFKSPFFRVLTFFDEFLGFGPGPPPRKGGGSGFGTGKDPWILLGATKPRGSLGLAGGFPEFPLYSRVLPANNVTHSSFGPLGQISGFRKTSF